MNGIIPHPKLVRLATNAAEAEGIATQNAVLQAGLTNGSFMQYEGNGIPTLDVSFATHYTHTPIETCHTGDLAALVRLVTAFARRLPVDPDLRRGA